MNAEDEARALQREINRSRRDRMTDRELLLEALERSDVIVHLLSTLVRETQRATQTATDAHKISSTLLHAQQYTAPRHEPIP